MYGDPGAKEFGHSYKLLPYNPVFHPNAPEMLTYLLPTIFHE
jgi:hypothetical protein